MRRSYLILSASFLLATAVVVACTQDQAAAPIEDDDAGTGDDDKKNTDDDDGDGEIVVPSNGIPCDVQGVLENRCLGCHGTEDPQGPALLKYEDFEAKATSDTTKTRGQLAAELMRSKAMPKAPGVALEAEIAIMEKWIADGMPKSTESCVTEPADAGPPDDAGKVDAGPAVDAGMCLSGVLWTKGDMKSPLMHPGGACLDCHSKKGGPALIFAGTVYGALHQPTDCNGTSGAVTVTFTDKAKKTVVLKTNAAGNFSVDDKGVKDQLKNQNATALTPPFKVTLTETGKPARSMRQTVPSGDCNSCHTINGTKVNNKPAPPGRILEPGAALK